MDPSPPRQRVEVDASSWTGVDYRPAYRPPPSAFRHYPKWVPIPPGWLLDVILASVILLLVFAAQPDPDATVIVETLQGTVESEDLYRKRKCRAVPDCDFLNIKIYDDKRVFRFSLGRTSSTALREAVYPGAKVALGLSKGGSIVSATVDGAIILTQIHGEGEIRWMERRWRLWYLTIAVLIGGFWIWWIARRLRGRGQ